MGLDQRDIEMMCVSIPTTDFWEMREELDRLADSVERLEKVVECLIALYHEERIKNWELILQEMLRREEDKKRKMIKPIFKIEDFGSANIIVED
jgi:hypothetical protein